MSKVLTVDAEAGQRVDVVAGQLLPTLSRAYIRRLIDSGRITLNNEFIKAGAKVRFGDKLKTDFEEKDLDSIEPIELPIIYEDKDVIVINKPAGVISHSRGKYWNEPSVASFIRQKTGQGGDRAGIVHRLDRATSGVMICAKNGTALSWLQKQFSMRKVVKTYLAVVQGALKEPEAIIDIPIERNPKAPATFRTGPNGKSAQTKYKVIRATDGISVIELTPLTGRTHQLRVHLKHLGHPIVGDELYGGPTASRLMLHAKSLTITLPSKKQLTFEAPLPKQIAELNNG
jgi:23S rRNA pseudouridine1911/1915/1917 synthase